MRSLLTDNVPAGTQCKRNGKRGRRHVCDFFFPNTLLSKAPLLCQAKSKLQQICTYCLAVSLVTVRGTGLHVVSRFTDAFTHI